MGFTTPCFILKNTLQLRKKLEGLGYRIGNEYCIDNNFLATDNNEMFGIEKPYIPEECNGYIHCGFNEELFLAIAALRDDTDRGQFFVTEARLGSINCPDSIIEKGSFIICCTDKWDSVDIPSHKASVLELIEHFKKQLL